MSQKQVTPHQEQVRECCYHIHPAIVLGQVAQLRLLKSKLLFYHQERVLALGADRSLSGLDKNLQSPILCVGKGPVPCGPNRPIRNNIDLAAILGLLAMPWQRVSA